MKKVKFLALGAAAILGLAACETLENLCNIQSDDLKFAEDYTHYLNAVTYVYQITDQAMRHDGLATNGTAVIDGANCTRTPDSLIIDFGLGTTCADGKIRKGALRMGYSGSYSAPGSTIGLMFQSYQENDLPLNGGIGLTNVSVGASTAYELGINNLSSNEMGLGGTLTATWLAGFSTQNDPTDDEFTLNGGLTLASLVDPLQITSSILAPVKIATNCPYVFVEGQIQLTPSDTAMPQALVDFIPGDCANVFNTTVDCEGNSLTFSYPIK